MVPAVPREAKDRKHKRWRDDAIAAADVAERGIRLVAVHLPPAILFGYVTKRLMEPMATSASVAEDYSGKQLFPISTGGLEHREVVKRLMVSVAPIAALLGYFYQGLQGVLAGVLTTAVEGTVAAGMRFKVFWKDDAAAEPLPGQKWYAVLDWPDALFLASLLPMVLLTLRAQGVERASVISFG